MINIAVFASGRGSDLEAIFQDLQAYSRARIALVGGGREAPALDRARRRGVPAAVFDPDDADAILELLDQHAIDWVVLAGYLKRVPVPVVERYRNRMLNIHPALLPKFGGKGMYGIHVHEAVLDSGETESGATVHIVDEQYDRGPIVAQRTVPVEPDDTPETLAARVLAIEHVLLPEVVRAAVEGRIRVEKERVWIEEER